MDIAPVAELSGEYNQYGLRETLMALVLLVDNGLVRVDPPALPQRRISNLRSQSLAAVAEILRFSILALLPAGLLLVLIVVTGRPAGGPVPLAIKRPKETRAHPPTHAPALAASTYNSDIRAVSDVA